MTPSTSPHPGPIVLLGSGETSATGGKAYDWLATRLPREPQVAVLETPAGFQPNSARVAARVAEYIQMRLQHIHAQVVTVPARRRGIAESPDSPSVVAPLRHADILFLGAGSPTYAVRQLTGSLAWHILHGRHLLGAAVVVASAATLAVSHTVLPVYEIYKSGDDLHWVPGLDLLGAFGLRLAYIPHWNNTEGGAELDTSRCFMGVERFQQLLGRLPAGVTIVGIDEHTALVIEPEVQRCRVIGLGVVTVLADGGERQYRAGEQFDAAVLGAWRQPDPARLLPAGLWAELQAEAAAPVPPPAVPAEVAGWLVARQAARARRDWASADDLRIQIEQRGWLIRDTADGPQLVPRTDG